MSDDAFTPEADARRSRAKTAAVVVGVALLFVALTVMFIQLLRPLAAPVETAAPPTAQATPNIITAESTAPALAPATPPPTPAPAPQGPRIAILLLELGPNPQTAQAAIAELPPAIGLAFSPYPDASRALAEAARAQGHEVWASVPMQPKSYPRVSPGPNTLLIANAAPENLRRLDWALARVGAPVGITAMMGSAFTESAPALQPVLGALAPRGLAFLDPRSSGRSVAPTQARAVGVRAASNDRFLDADGTIEANLAALEATAKRNGAAIGFARAQPASIAAIDAWADGLEAKGLQLVPPGSLATAEP